MTITQIESMLNDKVPGMRIGEAMVNETAAYAKNLLGEACQEMLVNSIANLVVLLYQARETQEGPSES
jgi:hypothetical protein